MIFLASFILRLIALQIPKVQCYDFEEYRKLSIDLIPRSKFAYTKWYHRTPAYVAWLHFWRQELFPQIILSCFSIQLLFNSYPMLGIFMVIWTIPYDINYSKESLLLAIECIGISLISNQIILGVFVLLLMLPFQSYGNVMKHNLNIKYGAMKAVFELWKPNFGVWTSYWTGFNYVIFIPYLALMIYWIRNVGNDVSIFLAVAFTIVYAIIGYAESRFREPIIPLIILWLIR